MRLFAGWNDVEHLDFAVAHEGDLYASGIQEVQVTFEPGTRLWLRVIVHLLTLVN